MVSVPKETIVTMNGTDITSYILAWESTRTCDNSIGSATIIVKNTLTTLFSMDETAISKAIIITRGPTTGSETYVFRGQVVKVNPMGGRIQLDCSDEMYKAVIAEATVSFSDNIDVEAGVISEIFKTLVTSYAGLNADNTSIQSTGSTNILKRFKCNNAEVFERLSALAKIPDWQFYYNPTTNKVYFEPRGYVDNGRTLTVGSEIMRVPKWNYDGEQIVNDLVVKGITQEVQKTTLFSGTGVQTTFTLAYKPVSADVYVGGVQKTGGKTGQSLSFDFEVDFDNKQIVFQAGHIPAAGSNNIQVNFTYTVDAPVSMDRSVSIGKYGRHKLSLDRTDLKTVADGEMFANNYLDAYSEPPVSTPLKVSDANTYEPGEVLRIIDTVNNINKTVVIRQVKMAYPYIGDEVTIGQREFKPTDWDVSVTDRIKRLEEETGGDQSILLQVFSNTIDINLKPRYYQRLARDVTIDGAWGKGFGDGTTRGTYLWGEAGGKWQGSYTNSEVVQEIILPDNAWEEDFRDTDFKDTGTTTATWNTTTQQATFTNGQILQTSVIDLLHTYTYITVRFAVTTGTLTTQISADGGSTYQTVTPNTRETITTSTTSGVKLKITSTGASTISNLSDAYGNIITPAIQVTLE